MGKGTLFRLSILPLLLGLTLFETALGNELPRICILAGNPGDEEHHIAYETLLGQLSQTFTESFGIPEERLTVLYGPKAAGYSGVCSRENLLTELASLREQAKAGDQSPVWIILIGHANKVRGGALFNLSGPDLSMRDFGREIAKFSDETPVVVWSTSTASDSIIRYASGPNRAIISATGPKDPENETEFPNAFLAALQDEATDSNDDGQVTVPELFLATRSKVLEIYQQGHFIIKEQAYLDGDGNKKGTSRPSRADTKGAARFFLTRTQKNSEFD